MAGVRRGVPGSTPRGTRRRQRRVRGGGASWVHSASGRSTTTMAPKRLRDARVSKRLGRGLELRGARVAHDEAGEALPVSGGGALRERRRERRRGLRSRRFGQRPSVAWPARRREYGLVYPAVQLGVLRVRHGLKPMALLHIYELPVGRIISPLFPTKRLAAPTPGGRAAGLCPVGIVPAAAAGPPKSYGTEPRKPRAKRRPRERARGARPGRPRPVRSRSAEPGRFAAGRERGGSRWLNNLQN